VSNRIAFERLLRSVCKETVKEVFLWLFVPKGIAENRNAVLEKNDELPEVLCQEATSSETIYLSYNEETKIPHATEE